jgi:hypothetical protein
MATAYKNVATLVGSTGNVTVYTCPTATAAVVKNINLYNNHSGAIVVYTKINDSSASTLVILDKTSLSAAADTSLSGPFVLESGDTLQLNCDTASQIDAFASILELS